MIKIGIIGGSGLDDPKLIQNYEELEIETPFGKPSSRITCGRIHGIDVCILARHGKAHEIPPSQINYRANIYALKSLGCTHILATSAIGSLRKEIKPGDLVFPDQFIDFTKQRRTTFHDSIGNVVHTPMSEPFSQYLRDLLIKTAQELKLEKHAQATIAVIEGPRFSTKAESYFLRNFADVVGMTTVPEVTLAKEAGLEYASIAMSTDYDCWKQDEAPVIWDEILEVFDKNVEKVKQVLINTIRSFSLIKEPEIISPEKLIKQKIRTIPNFPKPGIMFRDITTLLKDSEGMKKVIEILYNRYKDMNIGIVAGIESRGFIIGGILADKLNVGFVPIRKKGKLPGEIERQEYFLEYGMDTIEIHKDAIQQGQKVLIIDDLLATGGTGFASCQLIEKVGGKVVECAFIVELPDLRGRERLLDYSVFSIVKFEGD